MYQIGIDIGGTTVKAGLVSEGRIISWKSVVTDVDAGADKVIADIAGLVNSLKDDAGDKVITGVGIGCPGAVNSCSGIVDHAYNLKWEYVPLGEKMQRLTGYPTRVCNDANAAALGEAKYGAGKTYKSSVVITIGTGIGSGIIIDGKLFEGNQSKGAEIGHVVIKSGGEPCSCGRRGCFEAYSSATALIRDTRRAMMKNSKSKLWEVSPDIDGVNGKTVFDAMLLGDKTAKRVFDNYIKMLGEGLVNIVNALRPEAIILGGGVCAQGDVLLNPLKKYIAKYAFGEGPHVGLHTATLKNDAGIIGAAALVAWADN